MTYIEKEKMDKFIDVMMKNNITPLMTVGPYVERKYADKDRNPRLQTTKQIMKTLGVSKSTLYRYMNDGMPFVYKKDGRGRLFDKELCLAFISQMKAVKKKEAKKTNEQA